MIIFRLIIFSHSFQQFIGFESLYLTFDNSVQTLNQKISKKESTKKLPNKSQLSILRTGMLKPFGLVPNQLTAHRCKNSIFLPSYINYSWISPMGKGYYFEKSTRKFWIFTKFLPPCLRDNSRFPRCVRCVRPQMFPPIDLSPFPGPYSDLP